jgi:WD40 repeat protein
LKQKALIRTFTTSRGTVLSAKFHYSENYIALASSAGEVILHFINKEEQSRVLPITTKIKDAAIKEIEFSRIKMNVLAGCSEEGTVYVWDISTNTLQCKFASHSSPATSIAFSTVNHLLLCSAGLDKRIFFYDIVENK